MQTISETLYLYAQHYQDKRKAINDTYEARLQALERAKGSAYYTDELRKAQETRDTALKGLQAEYKEHFAVLVDGMRKRNAGRGMTPPTEEELRLLSALKMRGRLTQDETDAAAQTLKGNATALSILQKMAQDSGILKNYISYRDNAEMPVKEAERAINGLERELQDFLEYDTVKSARRAASFRAANYGLPEGTQLAKRPLFDNKNDCYQTLTGMTGDELNAFCSAVD